MAVDIRVLKVADGSIGFAESVRAEAQGGNSLNVNGFASGGDNSSSALLGQVMRDTSINVTNPGANYANTVPTITISDPDDIASNYQASATAVLTDGSVTAITINNNGKFYNTPNVSIEAVVGNSATATAQISELGEISGITVTNAGLGYRTLPAITVESPAATSVAYTQIEFDDDWGIITLIEDV